MDNNKFIIIALVVVIIVLLAVLFVIMPNFTKTDANVKTDEGAVDETAGKSVTPDTIKVELPEFDTKYTESVGEYTVEAEKWKGTSVGGFGVSLYKNGQLVDQDSYLSRAYFYMDGKWKWSEWGNGEDNAAYHKYPVSNNVKIQKVEVKF